MDWELCIKLGLESAQAINALHQWNPPIIHRDVKPQNLLVIHLKFRIDSE